MTILTFGGGGMSKVFEGIKVSQDECDVRDIAQVADTMGIYNPNIVIVTAGVSNPGPMESARFEEEIGTNLLGAFNVAQIAINFHVETLIFIASVAGLYGKPNHASYSASKAGVVSLVQSLALENDINAFAVAPGRVDTPMREKDFPLDTKGSRLAPSRVWDVVKKCIDGTYANGDCVVIRKVGLVDVIEEVIPTPWKDILRVGEPVNI